MAAPISPDSQSQSDRSIYIVLRSSSTAVLPYCVLLCMVGSQGRLAAAGAGAPEDCDTATRLRLGLSLGRPPPCQMAMGDGGDAGPPRGIEGLVERVLGPPTKQSAVDHEDCDTCRYTGTGLCAGAGVYLLVQRSRQAQHRGFLLGMAGGCFALSAARWFA
jgi:hypothetical protein